MIRWWNCNWRIRYFLYCFAFWKTVIGTSTKLARTLFLLLYKSILLGPIIYKNLETANGCEWLWMYCEKLRSVPKLSTLGVLPFTNVCKAASHWCKLHFGATTRSTMPTCPYFSSLTQVAMAITTIYQCKHFITCFPSSSGGCVHAPFEFWVSLNCLHSFDGYFLVVPTRCAHVCCRIRLEIRSPTWGTYFPSVQHVHPVRVVLPSTILSYNECLYILFLHLHQVNVTPFIFNIFILGS